LLAPWNVAYPAIQSKREAGVPPATDLENVMEPKRPIKSRELKEMLLPTVLYPTDTEDYFELACEDDEFGVHIPDQADDK
jgi:hypothetical protein